MKKIKSKKVTWKCPECGITREGNPGVVIMLCPKCYQQMDTDEDIYYHNPDRDKRKQKGLGGFY